MRRISPKDSNVARRLLRTRAKGEGAGSETAADALKRSCEALRPRLTQLVGRDGFRALLSRALALAKGEIPWLCGVQVDAAGSLTGLDEVMSGRDAADGEAGCAAVLAHLLGLLAAFVGAELTRHLVSGAWPDTAVEDTDFGAEE